MARTLALLATGVSLYLVWGSLFASGRIFGCGEGAGCGKVLSSGWSQWRGIPVCLGGVLIYGTIFFLLPYFERWKKILTFFIVLAAGAALWFIFLQIFVLKEICLYCNTVHLAGIGVALLYFTRLLPLTTAGSASGGDWIGGLVAGLLGVGILIAGQLWSPPLQPLASNSWPDSLADTEPLIDTTKFADNYLAREVELLSGSIKTTLGAYPVLGPPDAPKIMGLFFDYTCRACRLAHDFITVLQNRYAGKFAVILFPVPLSSACNPYVKGLDSQENRDACLFAKLALLVWKERPQDFARFDHFMFRDPDPPPADSVLTFVAHLLKRPITKTDLQNDSLLKRLEQSMALFHHPEVKRQILPVLLFPTGIHYGMTRSPLEIVARIRQELQLQTIR